MEESSPNLVEIESRREDEFGKHSCAAKAWQGKIEAPDNLRGSKHRELFNAERAGAASIHLTVHHVGQDYSV